MPSGYGESACISSKPLTKRQTDTATEEEANYMDRPLFDLLDQRGRRQTQPLGKGFRRAEARVAQMALDTAVNNR